MRYDVLSDANVDLLKNRFAIWLIDFWGNKIGEDSEVDEKVERSYLMIRRGKREEIFDFFDFETISTHDIDFFDVVFDVIDVADEMTDEINTKTDVEKIAIDVDGAVIDAFDAENAEEDETEEVDFSIIKEDE